MSLNLKVQINMNQQPNRTYHLRQKDSDPSLSEQQRKEERRGEELRRQIRLREQEIEEIARNKERLIDRIQNSLTLKPSQGSFFGQDSPTKSVQTFGHQSEAQIRPYHSLPENSHNLQKAITQTEVAQTPTQQEYLRKLIHDTNELQSQLHQVSQDLDRVTKDKSYQQSRLNTAAKSVSDFQAQLTLQDPGTPIDQHQLTLELRAQNRRLQFKLEELEHTRAGCCHELHLIKQEKERRLVAHEDFQADLTQKMLIHNELTHNLNHYKQLINQTKGQVQMLEEQIREDTNVSFEIGQLLDKFKDDIEQYQVQYQHIQAKYEHDSLVLTQERFQVGQHNQRHMQLLSVYRLEQVLAQTVFKQKQRVLNEFFAYCRFDSNCHRHLKALTIILERLGTWHKKRGFAQWHLRAFKPARTIKVNDQLAANYADTRVRFWAFQQWLQAKAIREEQKKGFVRAAKQIWTLKRKDLQKESQRVMRIWRDTHLRQKEQFTRLTIIMKHQKSNLLHQAVQKWRFSADHQDFEVRAYILQQRYCTRVLKLVTLSNLKSRTKHLKATRLMRLAHLLKAWQDSRAYTKFYSDSEKLLDSLRTQLSTALKQCMWDALRHHKETQKHELLSEELCQRVIPAIEQLRQDLENIATEALRQFKLRRLSALSAQVECKVASYFHHWLGYTQHAKACIKREFRLCLVRRYENQLRRGFDCWRKGRNFQQHHLQQVKNGQLADEGKKIQNDNFNAQNAIKKEQSRQGMRSRIGLTRCLKIWHRRSERRALAKWQETARHLKSLENAAGVIISHLRRKVCKNGFKLLCEGREYRVCLERLDRRCANFMHSKQLAKKRRYFDILSRFIQAHLKAKGNLKILANNLDVWLCRKYFLSWQDQGNSKAVQLARASQNCNSLAFDAVNMKLGEIVKQHTQHSSSLSEERKRLLQQGRKVLSNAFARSYYAQITRGFKKWYEVRRDQKHREYFCRERIKHFEKQRFLLLKSAFQNFVHYDRVKDIRSQIQLNQKLERDAWQLIEGQRDEQLRIVGPISHEKLKRQHLPFFLQKKPATNEAPEAAPTEQQISPRASEGHLSDNENEEPEEIETSDIGITQEGHPVRLDEQPTLRQQIAWEKYWDQISQSQKSHVLGVLKRRSDETNYLSRQRYLFQQWAKFTAGQKRFILSLSRTVSKAVLQEAFTLISERARTRHLQELRLRALTGMMRMRQKTSARSCLCEWRDFMYQTELLRTEQAVALQSREIITHRKMLKRVGNYQAQLRVRFMRQMVLRNHLKAWKTVHNWWRTKTIQTANLHDTESAILISRAVKKWRCRAELTAALRYRIKKVEQRRSLIYRRLSFRILKERWTANRNFALKLGHTAFKINFQQEQRAVLMQKYFVWSRDARDAQVKKIAALNLKSILHQLFKRKMCSHYNFFRRKAYELKIMQAKLNSAFAVRDAGYSRGYFQKWLYQLKEHKCMVECEENSPVVEQVLKEQQKLHGYKLYLQDQGYTGLEVQKIAEACAQRQKELLARAVARIQHRGAQIGQKPYAFDRWRQWVKLRQLMKFLLKNVENRLHPVKADLSIAFNRWKLDKKHLLVGKDRKDLAAMCEKNQHLIGNLDNLEDQAQVYMNQLLHTRDELVDNLMGSQRLAIAQGRDRLERGLSRSFANLSDHAHTSKQEDLQYILRQKLDQIRDLKHRMIELEEENRITAAENEDLRQFSLDGYAIARNVKHLSSEREKLSVDLSDKTATLQQLLDENDSLNANLRKTLNHHAALMQQQESMRAAGGRYGFNMSQR